MKLNLFLERTLRPLMKKAIRDAYKELGKIATGRTLRDTELKITALESKVLFEVILPETAIYIDSGRRAGAKRPPIAPIEEWMRAVGITKVNAYVIARGIAQNGIEPVPLSETILSNMSKATVHELQSDTIVRYINNQILGLNDDEFDDFGDD